MDFQGAIIAISDEDQQDTVMDFFDGVTLTAASMSSYCKLTFLRYYRKRREGAVALRQPKKLTKGGDWQ